MRVIDLLNKIANGELENGTKFRDKYTKKEYVFKPNSYAGIYPPDTSKSDEDWLLTLHSGWFRLDQEVEIVGDKKIEKLETYDIAGNIFLEDCCFKYIPIDKEKLTANEQVFVNKIDEIIDYINGGTNGK